MSFAERYDRAVAIQERMSKRYEEFRAEVCAALIRELQAEQWRDLARWADDGGAL